MPTLAEESIERCELGLRGEWRGFRLDARASWTSPRTALFGPSGSGKTTILESLCGLRRDVDARVVLAGRRLDGLPPRARRVGWVPQDAALFPHMTAAENIRFARRARGGAGSIERAVEALEIGPLLDRRADRLSGGERQRVAIARAAASDPAFLLLDEPLAAIDRPLRARILPFVERLWTELRIPWLVVSHDPLEVSALADHAIVLSQGRVVDEGDPRGLFASAAAFGAASGLGAENVFEVEVVARARGTLVVRTAGGCRLVMAAVSGFPEARRVCVRAEDVLVATASPVGLSAQNVLHGRILAISDADPQVLVTVEAEGERWLAKVTREAKEGLGLAPGRSVWLVLKAHRVLPA